MVLETLYNNHIQIIFNILIILLGLLIGIFVGKYLFIKHIYKGPDSNIISKEINIDPINGHKYKWVPKVCVCPISYSMDKLKNINYIDLNH